MFFVMHPRRHKRTIFAVFTSSGFRILHFDNRILFIVDVIVSSYFTSNMHSNTNLTNSSFAELKNQGSLNDFASWFALESSPVRQQESQIQQINTTYTIASPKKSDSKRRDDFMDLIDSVLKNTSLFEPVPLHEKQESSFELSLSDLLDSALFQVDSTFEDLESANKKRTIQNDSVGIARFAAKRRRLLVPNDDSTLFRPFQKQQWDTMFQDLVQFKQERGHCSVPHSFEENPILARWVKRQRYQFKLRQEGKVSTITANRIQQLEEAGFVWDSHAVAWQERLNDLKKYLLQNGHCNVPSSCPQHPQLATWVKCQRRQFKLWLSGKPSNMTTERIAALNAMGFTWDMRTRLFGM